MTKGKATATIRIYPETRKRIKVKAARFNKTIAEYIDLIEKYPLQEAAKNK